MDEELGLLVRPFEALLEKWLYGHQLRQTGIRKWYREPYLRECGVDQGGGIREKKEKTNFPTTGEKKTGKPLPLKGTFSRKLSRI